MSCCGQRRRALVSGTPVVPARRVSMVAPAAAPHAGAARTGAQVALRYTGIGPFTGRGVRSGRLYSCGGWVTTIQAEPADVEALLRTRLFARQRHT